MPESRRSKALRAIGEDRVRVVKANEAGVALDVESSTPDPGSLTRATYRVLLWIEGESIKRSCSCPAPKRCYHVEIAEMLWRPGPQERSSR